MVRPLRTIEGDRWYHVLARGNERKPVYLDRRDYERFQELVGKASERFGLPLRSCVLMPNHYPAGSARCATC